MKRRSFEISAIQDLPQVQQQMAADGADIVKISPAQFGAHMEKEMAIWGAW